VFVFSLIVAGTGAFLCGGQAAFVPALINALASLWAVGISTNYRDDRQNIPNLWAGVSIVTLILGVVFIIVGAVG
jgi:hypothetical protein